MSGEARWRAPSLNGGFISTKSALSGASPAIAKASAHDSTSSTITSAAIAFAAALLRERPASTSSISTSARPMPSTRRASANPAAPTPAPRSTTRQPARADVAAASSMASWPARWPVFNCRKRNRPPRKASSVHSRRRSVIGPQFMGKPGVGQQSTRRAIVLVIDQDAPLQEAERALDNAHVLVQHHMMDVGAVKQRSDSRNQNEIVGSYQFPQMHAPVLARKEADR